MKIYQYSAVDDKGNLHDGRLTAADVLDAIKQLQIQGLDVLGLQLKGETTALPDAEPTSDEFHNRLAAPEDRGRIIACLEALAEELKSTAEGRIVQELVLRLKRDEEPKDWLRSEKLLPWLSLVVRGSTELTSDGSLLQSLREAQREAERAREHRRAWIYPLTIMAMCGLLLIYLFVFVVPTFSEIVRDFHLRIPTETWLALTASRYLREQPILTLAAMVGLLSITTFFVRWWTAHALTTRLAGMWIAGNTPSVLAMARFSNTLADMLSLGAPKTEALKLSGIACRHAHFRSAAFALADELDGQGRMPNTSLYAHNFPANVIYALSLDRTEGKGIGLLKSLANMYYDEARSRPMLSREASGGLGVFFVGIVVFITTLALLSPFVQLITSLT
ncbi:MAG: hypothetical protein U0892_15300 [Pirellulales bacterium]